MATSILLILPYLFSTVHRTDSQTARRWYNQKLDPHLSTHRRIAATRKSEDRLDVQTASTKEEHIPDAKHQGIVGKASVVL
jgi:hypothetical protein